MVGSAFMWLIALWALAAAPDPSAPEPGPAVPPAVIRDAVRLRDAALRDDTAYRFVEALTTEVGPRLAGTAQEARARRWSVRRLKALGFKDAQISVETFEIETWVRGREEVEIVAPFAQPMVATALGRSASTGPRGIRGQVVLFPTLDELERADRGAVQGKIVYIGHAMGKTQDGSSYAYFGGARFHGPGIAAQRGAKAVMIRSVGTQHHRMPHTGATSWPAEQAPIPAVALSPPDADQVERIAARGKTMTVSMVVTPKIIGMRESGNIVVDIRGTDKADEIVIVGGHLDSWDLGTGAVDDGAGVAITTGAVHLIQRMGLKPRRTIRLVHFGAEEVGLYGAKAYVEAHRDELAGHVIGCESDFGAGRIYRVNANLPPEGLKVVEEMLRVMAPLGIGRGEFGPSFTGSGGPDMIPLHPHGLPRFRLAQDGFDYFDLHHTPDDTFDKIEPENLAQNVAAYAVFLWFAANAPGPLKNTATAQAAGP